MYSNILQTYSSRSGVLDGIDHELGTRGAILELSQLTIILWNTGKVGHNGTVTFANFSAASIARGALQREGKSTRYCEREVHDTIDNYCDINEYYTVLYVPDKDLPYEEGHTKARCAQSERLLRMP